MMRQPDRDGTITQRFVLLDKSTHFPERLRLPDGLGGTGWTRADNTDDLQQLEKKLFAAGWKCFYTAWTVTTIGFGFEKRGDFGK